ncbi:MAG: addiction module protein [Acidobacteria bacterium]|nr:addiction module protein [Acidobacteriota bacterium]MCI0718829.1 addiction module protein [Acidobacteriota bacterium]
MPNSDIDISRLTPEEPLDLIEELWESLHADSQLIGLTQAQETELDRRLDEMEHDGADGIPWEQVLMQIRGKR